MGEKDHRWSRVLYLEGAWNHDDLTDRSSFLPMLEMLERLREIEYVHRDVGTRGELEHYLRRWIDQRRDERLDYLVLHLAFHGSQSGISLSDEREDEVSLDALGAVRADELGDCVVHFGSCSVMAASDARLRQPARLPGTADRASLSGARQIAGRRDDHSPWG